MLDFTINPLDPQRKLNKILERYTPSAFKPLTEEERTEVLHSDTPRQLNAIRLLVNATTVKEIDIAIDLIDVHWGINSVAYPVALEYARRNRNFREFMDVIHTLHE